MISITKERNPKNDIMNRHKLMLTLLMIGMFGAPQLATAKSPDPVSIIISDQSTVTMDVWLYAEGGARPAPPDKGGDRGDSKGRAEGGA